MLNLHRWLPDRRTYGPVSPDGNQGRGDSRSGATGTAAAEGDVEVRAFAAADVNSWWGDDTPLPAAG